MNDQTVLEAFRRVIGDPVALTEPFESVLRPDEHQVTLLDVGGSVRLVAPDELTAQSVRHLMDKDPLFWDHASDSAERVAEAAGWRYHVAEVLGPAELFCTATIPEVARPVDALQGPDDGLADLIARTSPHEAEESGVRDLDVRFGIRENERLVAVAGWELWPGEVAKIGVLVDERARNSGLGVIVGAMATREALAAGLLPLWRASTANRASIAVAAGLGFESVGHQLSIVLVPGPA